MSGPEFQHLANELALAVIVSFVVGVILGRFVCTIPGEKKKK